MATGLRQLVATRALQIGQFRFTLGPLIVSISAARSDVHHQVANPDSKSFGHPTQRSQRNGLFATFDPTEVIWMQIGPFRQKFLRECGTLPLFADRSSKDDSEIGGRRHSLTGQQTLPPAATPLNG
jgi:hypothetical protein